MCKKDIEIINDMIVEKYDQMLKAFTDATRNNTIKYKQLLSCNAKVADIGEYYILFSYSTLVAFIEKSSDTCYDVLRYVYGYTATSAQHISKFRKNVAYGGYGKGKYGCEAVYTYVAK